jgi:hypothetical protein
VVPPGDPAALAEALAAVLERGEGETRKAGAAALAAGFRWERALAPLVDFCRAPRRDLTMESFAHRLETRAPQDPLAFRVRRYQRTQTRGTPGRMA